MKLAEVSHVFSLSNSQNGILHVRENEGMFLNNLIAQLTPEYEHLAKSWPSCWQVPLYSFGWAKNLKDSKNQGFKGFNERFKWFKHSKIQGFKDSRIQRVQKEFKDSKIIRVQKEFKDSKIKRVQKEFKDSKIQRVQKEFKGKSTKSPCK